MALVERRAGMPHVEAASLTDIAEQFDTPCYVYLRETLTVACNACREEIAQ